MTDLKLHYEFSVEEESELKRAIEDSIRQQSDKNIWEGASVGKTLRDVRRSLGSTKKKFPRGYLARLRELCEKVCHDRIFRK